MLRSDNDDDGSFSWNERKTILRNLKEGMSNDNEVYCDRQCYCVGDRLAEAGLEAPKVNTAVLWTSMERPVTMNDLERELLTQRNASHPVSRWPHLIQSHAAPYSPLRQCSTESVQASYYLTRTRSLDSEKLS